MMKGKVRLLICILATGLSANLANADIEAGLVGHWMLDDGSGTTALDSTVNGNDGTLYDGPTWETGPAGMGGALGFVAANKAYVDCGNDDIFEITDEITVSAWIKVSAFTDKYQVIVSKDQNSWMLARDSETPCLKLYCKGITGANGNYSIGGTVEVDDDEWHHIVGVYDGSTISIYADGLLDASQSASGTIDTDDSPVWISGRASAEAANKQRWWNGLIDDVRVYNRGLNAEEVLALWTSDPDFNFAPQVEAGDYQSILWQAPSVTAQLDATVNDDGKPADPCEVTLTWSKLSGPGTVTFDPCNSVEDPTATFTATGFYELQLSATDGAKDACDVVTIYVRASNDPIAHWAFETGSGSDVYDSVNDNDGVLAGDSEPNWVSGWVGSNAMEFFGESEEEYPCKVSSYVDITTDISTDPNLDNLQYEVTLAGWFKIDDLANTYHPAIIANGHQGWRLYVETGVDEFGKVTFTPGDSLSGSRAYSTKPVDDGYWHHVVGIYDGSKSYLYVDGVLDVTVDNTGLLDTTDGVPIIVGARKRTDDLTTERSWNGMLDDVRVYSYGLSDDQVADLAAMGALIPVVDAGDDQTFSMQDVSLQLDGTLTDDGEPAPATLVWSETSGPGDVDFTDTAIEDPCVTFSEAGTYVLRLTANDTMATVYDEVTITVEDPTCQNIINDGLLIIGDFSGPAGIPDCYINLYDFAAFAGNWLRCNNPQDSNCEFVY